jgi:MoxR-like ATPase
MKFTAGKMAIAMVAIGVTLGGCATRESVRNVQASADAADRHAGTAQARADEAYGIGNDALGVGHDAKATALTAAQKADQANADLAVAKKRIAYLEYKVLPHHKKKHHRSAPQQAPAAPAEGKPNNS